MTLPVRCPTCEALPHHPCATLDAVGGLTAHPERRVMAQLAASCPCCGATPGSPCRTTLTERPLLVPHAERGSLPPLAAAPAPTALLPATALQMSRT